MARSQNGNGLFILFWMAVMGDVAGDDANLGIAVVFVNLANDFAERGGGIGMA